MKNMKKFLALGLAAVMSLSLAACGDNSDAGNSGDSGNGGNSGNGGGDTSSGPRVINIGSWWVQPYDSDDAIEDADDYNTNQPAEGDDEATLDLKAFNIAIAEDKFANVTTLENKYNIKFYWQNLTYTGVQESINTSILAGSPDCDIYLVDTGMAIPAQVNNLALDLKTVLPADADILSDKIIMTYMDLGDGKASIIKRVEAQSLVEATYPLAFNKQMLDENGLENPCDLWERGEWTWDKFNEYCQILTQDTDGDGQIDQYGYCGYEFETFEQLMMANGANIASGKEQTLTSNAVGEALQQMYDMYNTLNVCYPYDFDGDPSNSMRNQYTQGNIGFFPIAAWIASGNNDYDYGDTTGTILPFETVYVRWPVGPSGNKDTNAGKNDTNGEFYIIPNGVKDPELVYNFLYDYWNWFDGDTARRDDKRALNWWYGVTARSEELQNHNFDVMADCGAHSTLDLWNSLKVGWDLQSLIKGETTPAQFQETYKNEMQAALDATYK